MRRFVILLHETRSGCHYDFMLEHGPALATWQLPQMPNDLRPGQSLPARALPDHRLAYLDYEGAVSGDRGCVKRVDQGSYRLHERNDSSWIVTLAGTCVCGTFRLSRRRRDDWLLEPEPDAPPEPHAP